MTSLRAVVFFARAAILLISVGEGANGTWFVATRKWTNIKPIANRAALLDRLFWHRLSLMGDTLGRTSRGGYTVLRNPIRRDPFRRTG